MIYHLSHIDLDGFFCQYLSTKKYKDNELKFYNSNYGPEIKKNIKKIMKSFEVGKDKLIITDLALSNDEIVLINDLYKRGVNINVYDHHENDTLTRKKYNWMTLDTSMSASKLYASRNDLDSKLLEYVNAYDMWDEKHEIERYTGAVLSEIINTNPLFYTNQDKVWFFNDFFMHLEYMMNSKLIADNFPLQFKQCFEEYTVRVSSIITEEYFSFKQALSKKYIKDMNLEINKKYFVVLFEMDREYFQYISSEILKTNKNLIIANFQKNGRVSFRSLAHDVNQLARDYYRGGGHKCASGGFVGRRLKTREDAINFLKDLD